MASKLSADASQIDRVADLDHQRKSSQSQFKLNLESGINEHAHLYDDDPKFDIEEMLKDESEDEEEQVNFEINQHKSQPINLESSHKLRNEIKESFFNLTNLDQDEKLEQMNLIRDSDFWLTKGISMTTHNQLSTAI